MITVVEAASPPTRTLPATSWGEGVPAQARYFRSALPVNAPIRPAPAGLPPGTLGLQNGKRSFSRAKSAREGGCYRSFT